MHLDTVLALLEKKGLLKIDNGLVLLNDKRVGEIAATLKNRDKQ
jgi:hypothetical protein